MEGIVKTLKDTFGFIERADIVKDVSQLCMYAQPQVVGGRV